jgi:hypothetical protein
MENGASAPRRVQRAGCRHWLHSEKVRAIDGPIQKTSNTKINPQFVHEALGVCSHARNLRKFNAKELN